MREEKRQLRNSPSSTENRQYTGSRTQRQRATNKARVRIAALGAAALLGVGAIAPTAIQKLANQINYGNDTKTAIEMVASNNEFFADIEEKIIMQTQEGQEQLDQLKALSEAAVQYKKLDHKEHRTVEEEQLYIEACKTICDSKDLVIDTYSDIIKGKAAEAFGITDAEEIKNIKVQDYVETSEMRHNPQITFSDGTIVGTKTTFLSSPKGTMDKTISSAIIEARHLIDVNSGYQNREIKDLPVDDIIKTFEGAKSFEEKYKFSVNDKGQLIAEDIEQSQEVTAQSIDDEER